MCFLRISYVVVNWWKWYLNFFSIVTFDFWRLVVIMNVFFYIFLILFISLKSKRNLFGWKISTFLFFDITKANHFKKYTHLSKLGYGKCCLHIPLQKLTLISHEQLKLHYKFQLALQQRSLITNFKSFDCRFQQPSVLFHPRRKSSLKQPFLEPEFHRHIQKTTSALRKISQMIEQYNFDVNIEFFF